MKALVFYITIGLAGLASVGLMSCARERTDGETQAEASKANEELKDAYSCPMHPEVTSEKPGKCQKCGMNLKLSGNQRSGNEGSSAELSPNDRISKARAMLEEVKEDLAKEGKYNCCIKDPCDRCALDHQNCSCGDEVKSGGAVCSDCYAGWQRGDGNVPGVKASSVKGGFHSHKH